MKIIISRYDGSLPLRQDENFDDAENVVWIVATAENGWSLRLIGMDHYYFVPPDADGFWELGQWSDDGDASLSRLFHDDGRMTSFAARLPPDGARVFHGVLLPDNDARTIGLID